MAPRSMRVLRGDDDEVAAAEATGAGHQRDVLEDRDATVASSARAKSSGG